MKIIISIIILLTFITCQSIIRPIPNIELNAPKENSNNNWLTKTNVKSVKDVPTIQPVISNFPDLTPSVIKLRIAEQEEFESLMDTSIPYDQMTPKQKEMVGNELYYMAGPFSTQEEGCSWYCAGGVYDITATSTLNSEKDDAYKPLNIHDFDLRTAWVEGDKEYGIGEKINFIFKMNSGLKVTDLEIYNGYCKSEKLWKDNSRVKTFGMYINGILTYKLSLNDTYKCQSFKIGSYNCNKEQDLILTLEILEIYPGDKYKDVVISEVNFDGTGSH